MENLDKVLEEIQSLERAEKQLAKVNQELDKEYRKLEQLQKVVDKEYEDVQKLEKLSMKGLFYKVLGDKEAQMEQERQEYLQAFLKYKEYKKSLELLEFEKKVLEDKLAKEGDIQKRKTTILKQVEQQHIQSDTAVGRQLARMEQQIIDNVYIKREVNEALIVGAKASDILKRMFSVMQTASNWGTWDMMGGKSTASYLKHSNIDKAKDLALSAKHILSQYERELEDVYGKDRIQLNLNLDSFHQFTDIFFDNLITDWIIQRKIQNALMSIRSVNDKVTRIQSSLKAELNKLDKNITYLEEQKKELILNK